MHNLQGGELKQISCAQMQDIFRDLLTHLRFIHSTPEGEHMHVTCARFGVATKILHTPQQMCSCAPERESHSDVTRRDKDYFFM